MDANVRAAAAETLRLCREAGHDVSPAVAALYVQAQRLAKVHPNDLVAHCVAKLAAAGDPALETLKMQMDVEATRALRAHAAAETRRARETRAGALEREVAEAKRERDEALAARRTAEGNDAKNAPWGGVANTNTNRPSSGSGESMNAPERAIAAVSYLLPLLDGLKYSKFLLMQFPMFGLALLPLKPAIDVWYALGFLQIIVFFGLYLGVVQNREIGENRGPSGNLPVEIRASSVFRRESDQWKMVSHHTDLLPFIPAR